MEKTIPFWEGVFRQDDEGGSLLGNKCSACGRIYFPKAQFCFDCLAQDLEEVVLSRRGKLYSYTIGRLPAAHFEPPYALGLIDLPEGLRVFAPLQFSGEESYRIGMAMEVTIEALWKEGDQQVIGYKFRPVV
ncbi:MAG: OB-fold domain-containing protein [Deltaproteobacteria bacterium]|nr:OB-fold domain-containing protein [Deltaproteobacteria bacterium]